MLTYCNVWPSYYLFKWFQKIEIERMIRAHKIELYGRSGFNWEAKCPLCDKGSDKNRNLVISMNTGIYRCSDCKAENDLFGLFYLDYLVSSTKTHKPLLDFTVDYRIPPLIPKNVYAHFLYEERKFFYLGIALDMNNRTWQVLLQSLSEGLLVVCEDIRYFLNAGDDDQYKNKYVQISEIT